MQEVDKYLAQMDIIGQNADSDLQKWLKIHEYLGEMENFRFTATQENAMLDFADKLKDVVRIIEYYHLKNVNERTDDLINQ